MKREAIVLIGGGVTPKRRGRWGGCETTEVRVGRWCGGFLAGVGRLLFLLQSNGSVFRASAARQVWSANPTHASATPPPPTRIVRCFSRGFDSESLDCRGCRVGTVCTFLGQRTDSCGGSRVGTVSTSHCFVELVGVRLGVSYFRSQQD